MTHTAPNAPSTDPPATLTVRNGTDVVEVVPYLLGFRPEESLVVVLLKDARVEVSARLDVAPLASREQVEAFARWLEASMRRFGADDAVLIVWSARQFRRWEPSVLATRLRAALAFDPLDVIDTDGATARSVTGVLGEVDAQSPVTVGAIAAGVDPFDSRAALAARVEEEPSAQERADLERLCRRHRRITQALDDRALVDGIDALLSREPFGREDAVALGQHLRERCVLDHLLTTTRRCDARARTERTAAAVRASPGEHRWAPLVAVAFFAWLSGDGALAAVCLEDLDDLGHDTLAPPIADLAGVVATLVGEAVDPRGWNEMEPGVA